MENSDDNLLANLKLAKIQKSLIMAFAFLILSPLVILASLSTLTKIYIPNHLAKSTPKPPVIAYGSVSGGFEPSIDSSFETSDSRAYLLDQYLKHYNSPLVGMGGEIVRISDMYSLDYRLLVAIAQQESNLCKIIPPETYNCWGWGIHSKGTLGFGSFKEAFHTVAKGLREEYLDKGYTTPEEIMSKYTPSSPGTWAFGVNHFMSEIEEPAS